MLHYPHINDKGTTECDILNGMGGEWVWEGGVRRSALTQSMQFKGDKRRVATADGLTDHQLVFSKSNTARSDTMGHNQNNDAQDCLPSPSRGMGGGGHYLNTTGQHNHSHLQLQQTKESATKEENKDFDFEKILSAGGRYWCVLCFILFFLLLWLTFYLKSQRPWVLKPKAQTKLFLFSLLAALCFISCCSCWVVADKMSIFLMRYFIALYWAHFGPEDSVLAVIVAAAEAQHRKKNTWIS